MKKSNLNFNKQFMIINGVLAIGVIAVIFIFLYTSFTLKKEADKKETFNGVYSIEVSKEFANDSLSIYINDSLLFNRIMPDSTIQIEIKRFNDDNVLIVEDKNSEQLTPFNLNKDGSKIKIEKKNGLILITESENSKK